LVSLFFWPKASCWLHRVRRLFTIANLLREQLNEFGRLRMRCMQTERARWEVGDAQRIDAAANRSAAICGAAIQAAHH
jgi:hypothetical protein